MTMRRCYVDSSNWRSPFEAVDFAGLGDLAGKLVALGEQRYRPSMRRVWVSTANRNAPFDEIPFAGLGAYPTSWPKGRSYWSIANFRAPYDDGFYQNNTLMGISESASGVGFGLAVSAVIAGAALGGSALAQRVRKGGVSSFAGATLGVAAVVVGGMALFAQR